MSEASRAVAKEGARQGSGWRRLATALVVGGLGLTAVSLGALADGPEGAGYGHHGMWGGGWGGMFFGFIMMLLVIAAIAAAVIFVARVLGAAGSGTGKPSAMTATDILEERFARGEIDAAEFEERRRLLAKDST